MSFSIEDTSALNYWLRKSPQPAAVLADEKRIEVPKNGRAWRDLTNTIKSLEPAKLTCLNGQGDVIRSIELKSDDDEAAPKVSQEMTDLQFFGKLLAEGYKDGRAANQPIVDNAMQFVDRAGQRLAKAEAEIDRLRGVVHRLQMQLVEANDAPELPAGDDSIMGTMLAGVLQGATGANKPPVVPLKQPQQNGAKK